MAHKIIWSYEATVDLEALAEYIARDSVFYAAAFVEEILTASRSLDEFLKEKVLFQNSAILKFVKS